MAAIAFDLAADQISPVLAKLSEPVVKTRILNAVGTVITSLAQRAFDEPSLRPTPWKPRKPRKEKGKLLTHPLMIQSGDLRQGIFHKLTGNDVVLSVKNNGAGSPTAYAAVHQLGSEDGSTPARPFFPVAEDQLTQEAEEEIQDVVGIILDSLTGNGR